MDLVSAVAREIRDVTLDRQRTAAMCLRMEISASRLRQRVKNARGLSQLTVAVTADEMETFARDLDEMAKLARQTHDLLRAEELALRPPTPITRR